MAAAAANAPAVVGLTGDDAPPTATTAEEFDTDDEFDELNGNFAVPFAVVVVDESSIKFAFRDCCC